MAHVGAPAETAYWSFPREQILTAMGSDPQGLTAERAAAALQRLRARVQAKARVERDGRPLEIPAAEVVPGGCGVPDGSTAGVYRLLDVVRAPSSWPQLLG